MIWRSLQSVLLKKLNMGQSFRNFRLLLWKNYLLQRRSWVVTLIELVVPIFIASILVVLRHTFVSEHFDKNTVYPSYDISEIPKNLTAPQYGKWLLAYDHGNITSVQQLMKIVAEKLNVTTKGFESEKSFIDSEVMLKSKNSKYLGLVAFDPISFETNYSFSKNVTYKIRLSPTRRNYKKTVTGAQRAAQRKWYTSKQYPLFQLPGPRTDNVWGGPPGYMAEGFLPIQHAVSAALISTLSGESDIPEVKMQRFPYPPYIKDNFIFALQLFFPIVVLFSYIYSALNVTKALVFEKEKRLKESMKVMGLSNWMHWTAWFVKDLLLLLISTIVLVILLNQVLIHSSIFVLFIFFLVYIINVIAFGFLISVFFSKANSASIGSALIFFLTYMPFALVQQQYESLTLSFKILLSLFGNTAMAFGAQIIVMWEGTGSGVQLDNMAYPASPDDNLTIVHIILVLLFDSFLYFVITWYIEAVFPGEFGMPLPFYFPFMPSYWLGRRHDAVSTSETLDVSDQDNRFIESNPVGLKAGISLRELCKVYKPSLIAVNNLSLDMFNNQVTALLGHNGAGKTTTMAMLTGIYPPTSGTALVDGYDIRYDISKIREDLGFCPQHDILFDDLTVEEHLYFYCTLKGWTGDAVKTEITRMVDAMNLSDKLKDLSKTLSGGMKRKLSVGIALCAGSKIVMLDEPTSGMDPAARRSTWDLLNNEKKDRTILLTTHYMEEADVLGDRIAILAGGKLQCCGSPMFLKKKYGAGYHMVLVKAPLCDVNVVTGIVTKHVPYAELESNMGAELSYILPHESSSEFENLFQEIEDNKEKLAITGYGASITTMEEVFIKVGENLESGEISSSHLVNSKSYNSIQTLDAEVAITSGAALECDHRNTGIRLIFQQVQALLMKRILYTLRNKLLTISQFLIPIFLIIMALLVIRTTPKLVDSSPLTISLEYFKGTKVAVTDLNSNNSVVTKLFDLYKQQLKGTEDKFMNVSAKSDMDYNDYLANVGKADVSKFSLHWIIGAIFTQNDSSSTIEATAFFNNQPFHSPPISLSHVQNALMKYYVNVNHSITVVNDPLPRTADVKALQEASQGRDGYQVAQNVMVGIAFLSAGFIIFIIKERTTSAKHLQVVSGVNLVTFWCTTFLWDFVNYLIPSIICVTIFLIFNTDGYKEPVVQGTLILLLTIHGIAILPFVYVMSFMFKVPSGGYTKILIMMVLIGVASLLTVTIMEVPQLNKVDLAKQLDWVFSLIPMYSLGRGVYEINKNYNYIQLCDKVFDFALKKFPFLSNRTVICDFAAKLNYSIPCCPNTCSAVDSFCIKYSNNYCAWDPPGIGRLLVFLVIDVIIFVCTLILIEKNVFRRIKYILCKKQSVNPNMAAKSDIIPRDDDVERERTRINKSSMSDLILTETLIFKDLTKNYGNLLAVDHLSLGISRGECFGLLGMNGAGKTSTFKMITGDEGVSEGDAYLDGYSIKYEVSEVQKRLGYCPQFDALIDELTGEETLRMFARLRGVPESIIGDVIQKLSSDLILDKHIKKLTKEYSGGNKRKLSTAIALIGNPPIIFLDEPTAGVDPVARRLMWKTICQVKDSGRSVLLTSHSMEECEALCGRLVIMVNGTFCCLGSPQHLKNKFGDGYTVLAKINTEDQQPHQRSNSAESKRTSSILYMRSVSRASESSHSRVEAFQTFFTTTFPEAELISIHQAFVHYHIPIDPSIGWAKIFGTMENAKDEYCIEDYTVSQTSLEQVFLQFAKMQRVTDD